MAKHFLFAHQQVNEGLSPSGFRFWRLDDRRFESGGNQGKEPKLEKSSPEKLAAWLFEMVVDTPILDYIPRENIHLICERAMTFFYSEGRLETAGLMQWCESEYGVPRRLLLDVLLSFKKEAADALGVEIVLPDEEADCLPVPVSPDTG